MSIRSQTLSERHGPPSGRRARSRHSLHFSWLTDSADLPPVPHQRRRSGEKISLSDFAFESVTLSDVTPDDLPNLMVDTGHLNNRLKVWVGD